MKYFLMYLILFFVYLNGQEAPPKKWLSGSAAHAAYTKTLTIAQMSENEKHERQRQLNQIASQISRDLLNVAAPEKIDTDLQVWADLTTDRLNICAADINRILVTARTAKELAQVAAHAQAQDAGLRSSGKVHFGQNGSDTDTITKKYITAQLNYETICTYLGIKP